MFSQLPEILMIIMSMHNVELQREMEIALDVDGAVSGWRG